MRIGEGTDIANALGTEYRHVSDTAITETAVIVESKSFRRHASHLGNRLFQRENLVFADVFA